MFMNINIMPQGSEKTPIEKGKGFFCKEMQLKNSFKVYAGYLFSKFTKFTTWQLSSSSSNGHSLHSLFQIEF